MCFACQALNKLHGKNFYHEFHFHLISSVLKSFVARELHLQLQYWKSSSLHLSDTAFHKYVRMTSPKQQQDSVSSLAEAISPESWSKVGCPCCVSPEVEPLVLIQLAENTESNTKQWIMSMISAPNTAGGERRLQIKPCKTSVAMFMQCSCALSNIVLSGFVDTTEVLTVPVVWVLMSRISCVCGLLYVYTVGCCTLCLKN